MAAQKINYSLDSLKIGDVGDDGGMGTVLEEIGINSVVRDTAVLSQAEGTSTSFPLEIEQYAFYQVTTPGDTTFAADFYVTDGEQLAKMFGGTYTPSPTGGADTYDFPANQVEMEKSVQFIQKMGTAIQVARMKVYARFEWNFKRTSLPLVHFSGTVLLPQKAGEPPVRWLSSVL